MFKTPPFPDEDIEETVDVEVKLRRPSDMETSHPLLFTYVPQKQGSLRQSLKSGRVRA